MVDHKQNAESDQKNGGWRLILSGSSSGHSGVVCTQLAVAPTRVTRS